MKLTKEDIKFIDNYLKNSGVNYIDIRYEMTDHVAAAMEEKEGDFLENFRVYMARNKKHLMQSNRQFAKAAGRRALRLLLQSMVKPRSLVFITAMFLVLRMSVSTFGINAIKDALGIIYILSLSSILLFFKFRAVRRKSEFSILDKLNSIWFVTTYIVFVVLRPDRLIDAPVLITVYYTIFMSFIFIGAYTFYTLSRKYKLQYDYK